ncbi:MAG: Trk system potassium transporter TrkA [Acutalibacteraceae bacterium]
MRQLRGQKRAGRRGHRRNKPAHRRTGSDEVNLLSCMVAKNINPNIHTIARVRNPEYSRHIYEMRDLFGLSMVFNPERQAALEISRLLKYPVFLKLDTFARGRAEIVELRITPESKLCGIRLSNIYSIVRCKILVCAVVRNGDVITPSGDFVLQAGDKLFVTAPSRNLTSLLRNIGVITKKAKQVILCGGGRTSFYLADQLIKNGISVKVIDSDPARCRHLAELLPDADIINGDASSHRLLTDEGVDSCDTLISLTNMDEINIIISLYGNSHNVPQIITKLARVDDSSVLDNLPLGCIISPKELCCSSIIGYVRGMQNKTGAADSVHFIADGKAEAMEFEVGAGTRHCGEPLKDIRLKKDLLIACIIRGGKIEIPDGESKFALGDTMIIVTNGHNEIYQLNDIFE